MTTTQTKPGKASDTAKAPGPAQPKVLLVDDQPARLLTYESILEGTGVTCVRALSGIEALERLLKDIFAVILLDVSMPDMDGFETARRIREHPRFEHTPIIFVTGVHITELDKLRGYEVGAIDYIPVPLVPEILRSKVTLLVELYSRRAELQILNRELEAAHARLETERNEALSSRHAYKQQAEERSREHLEESTQITLVVEAHRSESGAISHWRYLDANAQALRFLNRQRADLIGMRLDDELVGGSEPLATVCSRVLKAGESFRYEAKLGGQTFLLSLFPCGENTVVVLGADQARKTPANSSVLRDTAERKRDEDERRRRVARSAALLRLSDRFRALQNPAHLAYAAAEVLGETLGVSRCGYGTVDTDSETITIERDWNAPGSDTIAGLLHFREYGTYIDELKRGETVVCVNVNDDPRTAATADALKAIQVQSFVNMPVIEQEGTVALLYLTHTCAREWPEEELSFIREVAERTRFAVERRRNEQAVAADLELMALLRDLSARLVPEADPKTLFDEILVAAIAITAADAGTIQLLDQERQELTFATSRGLDPRLVEHFARVDARSGSSCGRALATGQRVIVEFDVEQSQDSDGSLRLHFAYGLRSAQSTPLVSRSGRILGMFSTHWRGQPSLGKREERFLDLLGQQAADLIERMEVEHALKESDRRKTEFIAMLSHELRNPLVPIRTGIGLLKDAPDPNGLLRTLQPVMERQMAHFVRLIDDLLDVSRITSGRFELRRERIALSSVIETAVEAHQEAIAAKGIELTLRLNEPDRLVTVDSTRFVQVVSNLLSNAVKFTPAGGSIVVTADVVQTGQTSGELVLKVTDTGGGISPDRLQDIFSLFATASSNPKEFGSRTGLGVGLALARRIVELHGGTLEAFSDGPGHGAQFIVRAPVVGVGSQTPVDQRNRESIAAGTQILVVDDNRDSAELLVLLLRSMGAAARAAYDGGSALKLAGEITPRIVLLDIGMPDVDGYEVCQELRKRFGRALSIVALTGWGQERDKLAAARAGFDEHLTKPTAPEALKATITRLLEN